jgi:antitoxin (DNA-binding transcriptional repressor) of toxin-antitoxin stability system
MRSTLKRARISTNKWDTNRHIGEMIERVMKGEKVIVGVATMEVGK